MSIDTYEPVEDIVIEQEENSLNDFSVEREDVIDDERNIENDLDIEDINKEKIESGTLFQSMVESLCLNMEDWEEDYIETNWRFENGELFDNNGISITQIIRNSDLDSSKKEWHEAMLNHFTNNPGELFNLPDWTEKTNNGEIIHKTATRVDKDGRVENTGIKYEDLKEEEDKEKDDSNNLVMELEEVVNIEEKELINISKIEETNNIQNEEEKDIVLGISHNLDNNEEIIYKDDSSDLSNNESISKISYPSENISEVKENILSEVFDDEEGKTIYDLQNEVIFNESIKKDYENITETKEINNVEKLETVDISESKEVLGNVNIVNHTENKDSIPEDISRENIEEINSINEINISTFHDNNIIEQDSRENFNIADNTKINESINGNIEIQEEFKRVIIEKENPTISNDKDLIKDIDNEEKSKDKLIIDDIKISNEEIDKKETIQENKEKTLEEKIIDLFKEDKDEKVDISKEFRDEKQNDIQSNQENKEKQEEVNVPIKTFSKEIDISKNISEDKKELKYENNTKLDNINLVKVEEKLSHKEKEIILNKVYSNEIIKGKDLDSDKDVINISLNNEKIKTDNLAKEKEVIISGHEILMKTLGLSTRLNNEGSKVVYSSAKQYQKDEDDNKMFPNKFAYKPSNLNGISLKIKS